MIDLEKLEKTKHMFEWISDNPFDEIVESIASMYNKQVPGTKLKSFTVLSDPQWLTGGKKSPKDESKIILVRTGVAFSCKFELQDNSGVHCLNGVFSWVAVNLDTDATQQKWMDLGGTLEAFGSEGELKKRIYSL